MLLLGTSKPEVIGSKSNVHEEQMAEWPGPLESASGCGNVGILMLIQGVFLSLTGCAILGVLVSPSQRGSWSLGEPPVRNEVLSRLCRPSGYKMVQVW